MKENTAYNIFGVVFSTLCILSIITNKVVPMLVFLIILIYCFMKSDSVRTKYPLTEVDSGDKP